MNLTIFAKLYCINNDLGDLTNIQRAFIQSLASMKMQSNQSHLVEYQTGTYFYYYMYESNFLYMSLSVWIKYFLGINNNLSEVEDDILIFTNKHNLKIKRILLDF